MARARGRNVRVFRDLVAGTPASMVDLAALKTMTREMVEAERRRTEEVINEIGAEVRFENSTRRLRDRDGVSDSSSEGTISDSSPSMAHTFPMSVAPRRVQNVFQWREMPPTIDAPSTMNDRRRGQELREARTNQQPPQGGRNNLPRFRQPSSERSRRGCQGVVENVWARDGEEEETWGPR
ncbi:hypothetical protein Droror1_Dr00015848 [Drosera rotundifolia]